VTLHPNRPRDRQQPPARPSQGATSEKGASTARNGAPAAIGYTVDPRSGRWPYGGFAVLRFTYERTPGRPASDATWAWSVRRIARRAVWVLPGYAVVYGSVTLVGAGDVPFHTRGRLPLLLGWVAAIWLGVVAAAAVTGLLVAARTRTLAAAGLVVGVAGAMLLLPFGGLPDPSAPYGAAGRVAAVVGAALYTLGWGLTGLALYHSGVFTQADGALVMIAAPMLGLGGTVAAALHSLGAVVALAAGIGVAWRAGRLVPKPGGAALTGASSPDAVAARVPAGDGAGAPAGGGLGPLPGTATS